MPAKSVYPNSITNKNSENDSPQNNQKETRQSNSNVVQRIAARLARVEEKFSHYPVIESYLQNNKMANTTLEDKFKFIEFVGSKLNEKISSTDDSILISLKDSISIIERQLFKNSNIFEKDDLRSRILRIGRFQESNYKTIKQQINNLITDPDVSFEVMKHSLINISRQMNEQQQIASNDFENIETLKNITKVAYSPQSTIEMLRDSLKKSLSLQQNSQTKIQELQRKSQYLEEQVQIAMKSANKPQEHSDDLFLEHNYSKSSYISSTQTRNARPRIQSISSYQPTYAPSPRKSRAFDLDDDSEMDSFALREAFEPEVREQYQDHLDQMNAQLRRQGMSMHEINAVNEIFTDCFIDLRSKILVQQDAISSLEKDKMQVRTLREKIAQQELLIQKLQATLKESIKENPEYKKQLKTIQLLTVKLNQAKNKIVFNQENIQKVKKQLEEKEDQRKRTEIENNNLRKDIEYIQQALDISNVDAENMRNLEIQSKGVKGLLERLKKAEQMCEDQQNKIFNMYNLIVKLRNRLESNGIQIPEEEKIEFNIQKPKSNTKGRSTKESASYVAASNNHSNEIDDDGNSVHNQTTRNSMNGKQNDKEMNSKQIQGQQSLTDTSSNNNSTNENSTSNINNNTVSTRSLNNEISSENSTNSINNNTSTRSLNNEISSENSTNSINNNASTRSLNSEISNENSKNIELNNNSRINNFTEEIQKMKCTCESLQKENDRLTKTLSAAKEEEKKKYESEINTLREHISKLEIDKQNLQQLSLKQSTHVSNFQNQISKLQSEAEAKLSVIIKKVAEMDKDCRSFISANEGLGSSSKKNRKAIEELSRNLQVANNTIITLRNEKDSLLKILCSESNHSKIADDKINKNSLPNDVSTDRLQLNLQQIDEQVTCQIDDVKNVKSSILNENQKEAF